MKNVALGIVLLGITILALFYFVFTSDVSTEITTTEEFIQKFRAAYDDRDVDAVMNLHWWDDVPASIKELTRFMIEDELSESGQAIVLDSVRMEPYEENKGEIDLQKMTTDGYKLDLEPVFFLYTEHHGAKIKGRGRKLIGRHGDALHFIVPVNTKNDYSPEKDPVWARVYGLKAIRAFGGGDFKEGAELLKESITRYERILGRGHPRVATYLELLATENLKAGNLETSANLYDDAIGRIEQNQELSDQKKARLLPTMMFGYAEVLGRLNREADADRFRERARELMSQEKNA